MTPFGCFGDAAGSAVRLSTVWAILLDGANGVSQAPRLCTTLEPSAWLACVLAVAAVIAVRMVGAQRAGSMLIVLLLLAVSYVPGWTHLLLFRADRPGAQRVMSRDITATRAAYISAMKTALAAAPTSACFVPSFVGSCVEPSGLFLGAARDLRPRWQCVGGELARVSIEISDCSPTNVRVRVVP